MRHSSSALALLSPPGRAGSPRRSRGLLAGLLAALLMVAGCSGGPGGDDDPGTAGSGRATSPSVNSAIASASAAPSDGPDPSSPTATAERAEPPTTPSASETAPSTAPSEPPADGGTDSAGAALQALAGLPIKGRAPKTGYSRDQFGQAWSDDVDVEGGHNGCDTRNDILRRDITAAQIKPGTQGCVVLSGTLADAYSDQVIAFVRGETTSEAVQIDHLVALSNAWQTGAQQLTATQRQDLANDPLNLQAVSGPVNDAKGDGDAATWLPPHVGYRCEYVTRQIEVKARYGLWVVPAEHDALASVLAGCGTAPTPAVAIPAPATPVAAITAAPATAAQPPAASPAAGEPYYENCAAERAAGAAPLHQGQPGYRAEMDGDGDGIACES